MSWKVHVPDPVKWIIADLPRPQTVQVYTSLHTDLAVNVAKYRSKAIPGYKDSFRYRFYYDDHSCHTRFIYTFTVEEHQQASRLVILSFKQSKRPLP